MDASTRLAVERLRAGDLESARRILAGVILEDRENLSAWLCLSVAVETDSERRACLEQALVLDPGNPLARHALDELEKRRGSQAPPARQVSEQSGVPRFFPRRPGRRPPESNAWMPYRPRFYPPGRAPEQLLFHARPSLAITVFWGLAALLGIALAGWFFRGSELVLFLILLPLGITGLSVFFLHFLTRLYARYTLTNRRVILEGGLFYAGRYSIPVADIISVTRRQSWFGLLFHTGDLVIVDRGRREHYLYAVNNSSQFLAQFQTALIDNASQKSESFPIS